MNVVTLSHFRRHSAFVILATFNDTEKNISKRDFDILIATVSGFLSAVLPDVQVRTLDHDGKPNADAADPSSRVDD